MYPATGNDPQTPQTDSCPRMSLCGVGVVPREVRTADGGASDRTPGSFSRCRRMIPFLHSEAWAPVCGLPSPARVHRSHCPHTGCEVRTRGSGSHPCSQSLPPTPALAMTIQVRARGARSVASGRRSMVFDPWDVIRASRSHAPAHGMHAPIQCAGSCLCTESPHCIVRPRHAFAGANLPPTESRSRN